MCPLERNKIINPLTGMLIYLLTIILMYILVSDIPAIHDPIVLSTIVAMLSNILITVYTLASTNCKPLRYVIRVVVSLLGPAIILTAIIVLTQ